MDWLNDLWNWFRGIDDTTSVPKPTPLANEHLLALHNNKRGPADPLVINDKLTEAARKHAEWMAQNEKMTHTQGRRTVADRANAEGYSWNYVGENIAMGYLDAESVFSGWMKSPGHKANILNKNYKDVGFGLVKSPRGSLYWCAVFGRQA